MGRYSIRDTAPRGAKLGVPLCNVNEICRGPHLGKCNMQGVCGRLPNNGCVMPMAARRPTRGSPTRGGTARVVPRNEARKLVAVRHPPDARHLGPGATGPPQQPGPLAQSLLITQQVLARQPAMACHQVLVQPHAVCN